jgi:hypothetical protein
MFRTVTDVSTAPPLPNSSFSNRQQDNLTGTEDKPQR